MTEYRLTVEHDQDDVVRTTTPSGHTLVLDSSASPGGEGPSPLELLLTSLGACALMDIQSILTKKRLAFTDLKAEVIAQRREEYPRAFTSFEILFSCAGEVPPKDLERACQLSAEKYCSVMATVREGPAIGWRAEVRAG